MIRCCINGYNEIFFIESCLNSLRNQFDHVLFVDGAYKEFPHKEPWSADGTLDIVKQLCDEVIETKEPWENEIVKRNQYLKGEPGDYYFVIDCDEILYGDIKYDTLVNLGDDIDLMMKEKHDDGYIPGRSIYRLFKHRQGLQYKLTHHALWLPGVDVPLNNIEHNVIKGCYLEHYTKTRPTERNEKKGVYYRWMAKHERVARNEHKL